MVSIKLLHSMNSKSTPATSNFRWIICALLFFSTTVNYMDRQVISYLKEFFCTPAAAGGSRPVRLERDGVLVVEASAPIVGQELLLRADGLLAAYAAMADGIRAESLRVVVGRGIIK